MMSSKVEIVGEMHKSVAQFKIGALHWGSAVVFIPRCLCITADSAPVTHMDASLLVSRDDFHTKSFRE